MTMFEIDKSCFFCHTIFQHWKTPQGIKVMRLCKTCYDKTFKEPNFEDIFGELDYDDHVLFLGTVKVGKTNTFLWVFKHTKLRCVWFHSVPKVDVIKTAEITLDDKDIYNGKLQEVLENPIYKKILIVPSVKFTRNKKNTMALFEYVCDICFEH